MPHLKRLVLVVVTALAVTFGGQVTPALAANPYERGPGPTVRQRRSRPRRVRHRPDHRLLAPRQRLRRRHDLLPDQHRRRAPSARSRSRPGFTASQSSIAWLGPRIASQGFVVFTIDTITDLRPAGQPRPPAAGGAGLPDQQQLGPRPASTPPGSASWATRWAAAARSTAANSRPALQAAIPLTAVEHHQELVRRSRVPTLVVGAENDTVAPVASHAEPFYTSMPGVAGEGLPGAQRRQPLRAQLVQHHDRQVQHLVAQAVRRQRHPLRAVPRARSRPGPRSRSTATPARTPAEFGCCPSVHGQGPQVRATTRREGETFPAGLRPSTPENRPAAIHTAGPAVRLHPKTGRRPSTHKDRPRRTSAGAGRAREIQA